MTRLPLLGHDPRDCTDHPVGLDVGELAPGHRLIVRGICLKYDRLWLYYAWVPGITGSQGEESGVWLTVEYGADVLPDDLNYAGSYDTDGGASSEGEIGYSRPPGEARCVWFDFFATDDDECEHRVARLTIELATVHVQTDK